MKLVIIDHKDSFTYNLVEIFRKVSGARPDVIDSNQLTERQIHKYDKIILSPGPGLPSDFVHTRDVFKKCLQDKKQVLGICLGHQAIAYYFGAKLINLPEVVHGQRKKIKLIYRDKIFENFPETTSVGLYHSWIVSKENFPQELVVTAVNNSGQIMALRHQKLPVFGLQFHPESFLSEHGFLLIENFIKL